MGEFTKIIPRQSGERKLSTARLLATRFFIYCLESAIDSLRFPRDESLFKIEMEFQMPRIVLPDHVRSSLAERLARIYRKIVFGRERKVDDPIVVDAVAVWIQRPEIKPLIAELELTKDA